MNAAPPKYALKFLRWFCREDCLDEIEGDLTELYRKHCLESSSRAHWKFASSVIRYLRPEYMKLFQRSRSHSLISISMIQNYFTLAFRNIRKRATFSFINIVGLAMGVCACLVILKYIDFETSYDTFNVNAASLYRINRTFIQNEERKSPNIMTTYGLGPALATDLPEVKRYIRTHTEHSVVTCESGESDAKVFHEENILAVDSTFLRAFTFKTLTGNLSTALDQANAIVLTQSVAHKYFGAADPIGKTLTLAGGRMSGSYTVSSVMEDIPQNSHFDFDILVPLYAILQSTQYQNDDGWAWNNFTTYIQLNDGANQQTAEQKFPDFCRRRLDPKWKDYNGHVELKLQPLRDIHLHPGLRGDVETVSRGTLYFFGMIAVFIVLIAWINYINLSTARAMERAREVGIKKAIGAFRSELITQFLFESVVINFISTLLAVGLAITLLPVLGDIIGKELSFQFSDVRLWFALAGLSIVGTLASGIYPAFVLSSFRITKVLKGNGSEGRGFSLRKALVVFQFAASLILITGTFVVYRQIHFMQSQDKGLQMDQMLVLSGPGTLPWKTAQQKLEIFKEEVKKMPGVKAIATSGAVPGGGHNWGADIRKSGTPVTEIKSGSVVWVDPDFIPTYNITFIAGKNFDPRVKSDMESVIINEASLAAFGLGTAEQALKEQLVIGEDTASIIGVLKNYNWSSLKSDYTPFLFLADTIATTKVSIHLAAHTIPATIEAIDERYKTLIPGEPFEYTFVDDSFNRQYKSDQQFGSIFGLFATLAVAISCLGLWGLASFTTSQKMKEIGIRKVLGASISGIVILLLGQFLQLVLVASFIALPLSWYGINTWLQGFAFHIGLHWDLFVLPIAILMLIAFLTVSMQVVKGAITNPAKILRSE
ncbi:ABC transporter permease [Ohtaekwangia koreensis]|uniref:Putative ABC transport system permease protein n=1 Tax=Ohtaekwangia koreensis TaxID=688867 RepID=A0A1T5KQ60_9BACT|nr:ABC transporter permease [Ohtaekwangia koreensis]SKC65800.1 putative ABC transport system permease protein [Ohtaekwangia koreensis]